MHSNMIPLSGMTLIDFTPSQLQEGFDPKPVFFIRVPTFAMRDKMAAILFQRGMVPPTITESRGILIDALYELYIAEHGATLGEAKADEDAAFLEEYWTKAEVHEELVNAWSIREATRLFDVAHGVPRDKVDQEPIPPAPYTMREQAKQARITMHVIHNHERFRAYQARFVSQGQEESDGIMRLFLSHWTGCGDVEAERDELDRLTTDCIEKLRGWLQENGAHEAWDAVVSMVKSQFGAPGGLEKNLGSPSGMNSNLTGLLTQNEELASSDGSSTTSPTEAIPGSGSQEISGKSRGSRSGKSGRSKAAPRRSGRTAGRS
jgi:hypothetical protein